MGAVIVLTIFATLVCGGGVKQNVGAERGLTWHTCSLTRARPQPFWRLARETKNISGCGRASPVTPLRRAQCSRLYCSRVGAIAS